RLLRVPAGQLLDVLRRHRAPVLAAQEVFEQDAERIGETRHREASPLERVQPEDLERATCDLELRGRAEGVGRRHSTAFTSTTKYWVSPKHVVGIPMCWRYASVTRLPIVWFTSLATESSRTVKLNFSAIVPGIETIPSSPSQVLQIQPFFENFCT